MTSFSTRTRPKAQALVLSGVIVSISMTVKVCFSIFLLLLRYLLRVIIFCDKNGFLLSQAKSLKSKNLQLHAKSISAKVKKNSLTYKRLESYFYKYMFCNIYQASMNKSGTSQPIACAISRRKLNRISCAMRQDSVRSFSPNFSAIIGIVTPCRCATFTIASFFIVLLF